MKYYGRELTVLDSTLSWLGSKGSCCGSISGMGSIWSKPNITELSISFCMLYITLAVQFYLWYYFVSIPKELKEEITRVLTANNPQAPQNIIRYSFKVSVA